MTSPRTGLYVDARGRIDLEALKRDHAVEALASTVTDLKRCGSQLKGLCPPHAEETASFFVDPAKQLFYCFGCGEGGDVIDLQRMLSKSGFLDACRELAGLPAAPARPPRRAADPAESVRRALAAWRGAGPLEHTPSATYLASRSLEGPWPGSLRHGRVPRWWDRDGRPGLREHALLAAVQDASGRVTGVQRVFLLADGRRSPRGSPKLSLGRVRGAAVRLGPVAARIMLAAAVEDALALVRMFPGASVWAALGDSNLPTVVFPPAVRRVAVCGDADEPGRAAAAAAAAAFAARGLEVADLAPRAGAKDFAEEWATLHA